MQGANGLENKYQLETDISCIVMQEEKVTRKMVYALTRAWCAIWPLCSKYEAITKRFGNRKEALASKSLRITGPLGRDGSACTLHNKSCTLYCWSILPVLVHSVHWTEASAHRTEAVTHQDIGSMSVPSDESFPSWKP